MKKSLFLFIVLLASIVSNAQTICTSCNGYGRLICSSCNGSGVIYQQVYNPYSYSYQNVPYRCQSCSGSGQLICGTCSGKGYRYNTISFKGYKSNELNSVSVSLSNNCKGYAGSLCSCKKYIGYRVKGHTKGWYYGDCRNCGHSPSAHGLHEAP